MNTPITHVHLWNKGPYEFQYRVTIDRRTDDLRHGKMREYKLNPERLDRIMKVLVRKSASVILYKNGFTVSYIPDNLETSYTLWGN